MAKPQAGGHKKTPCPLRRGGRGSSLLRLISGLGFQEHGFPDTGRFRSGSHFPDVTHLAYDIHLVDGLGGPTHHFDPVLKVGLLHRLTFGDQFTVLKGAIDFQDGGPAVGTPLLDRAQLLPELLFGNAGDIMDCHESGHL